MLLHNLKIAMRISVKNLGYTLINFLGIAVGLAVCLLIGIYIQHELSYDSYHRDHQRIYRLAARVEGAAYENGIAKVSGPWGIAAAQNIPEVANVCRFVSFGEELFAKGSKKFYESNGYFADSSAFVIFSWNLLRGDRRLALKEPNSIVLTRTFAEKYFGQTDPIGQVLTVNNNIPYRVSSIMEDVPENSHFRFDFLASMSSYSDPDMNNWGRRPQFYTYLLLQPGALPAVVAQKMDKLLANHLDSAASAATTPLLQPVRSIHLYSKLFREMEANSDISYVYIFGTLGLFIIFIACLNFINLSTVQATRRSNEVGIRKVNGASRASLVWQYLSETMMLCFASMILAIALAYLALPYLNEFLGKQLRFHWSQDRWFSIGLPALVLLVAFFSGFYPALVLSSFKPVRILSKRSSSFGHFGLRRLLVVCQFVLSIFMIIAAIVSGLQLQYIHNKNLGFNKNQVVIIPFHENETVNHLATIKEQLKQIPGVQKISASANRPGGTDFGIPATVVGIPADRQPDMRCLVVDQDFLDTYEMKVIAGRGFRVDMSSDTSAYLINEEAARQLGLQNPVGHMMEMPALGRPPAPIIGLVKDFHFRSLHEKIAPIFFFIEEGWFGQLSVRINAGQMEKTLGKLKEKWATIEPQYPFAYSFFDEGFDSMYRAETRTATIIRIFALLAVFIACLGLFGLAAYTAGQRTREISIRKILGASVVGVTSLLSKDFLKLVVLAAFIAFPISWWAMNKWLEDFAYRIRIEWWVFVLAGMMALLIALITVSFQAIKAALANPVKNLRSE